MTRLDEVAREQRRRARAGRERERLIAALLRAGGYTVRENPVAPDGSRFDMAVDTPAGPVILEVKGGVSGARYEATRTRLLGVAGRVPGIAGAYMVVPDVTLSAAAEDEVLVRDSQLLTRLAALAIPEPGGPSDERGRKAIQPSDRLFAPSPIEIEIGLPGIFKPKTSVRMPVDVGSGSITVLLGLAGVGSSLALMWVLGVLQPYVTALIVTALAVVATGSLLALVMRLWPRTGFSWAVADFARSVGQRRAYSPQLSAVYRRRLHELRE